MLRLCKFAGILSLLFSIGVSGSWAQSTSASTHNSPGSASSTSHPGQLRQQPCWQQAGISASVIQQRREMAQSTRSEVEAVCSNSSLSPQQKHQQIQQIRSEAHQKMEGMISAQQMQALERCRAARGHAAHAASGGNPCGSTETPTEPTEEPER